MNPPKNYGGELVLALDRQTLCDILKVPTLPTSFIPDPNMVCLEAILSNAAFTDRTNAEINPSLKQLIPYAVVMRAGKVLAYRRGTSGGEGRLHGKVSIGVGGHINPVDIQPITIEGHTFTSKSLLALIRELKEELGVELGSGGINRILFQGYVNEEVNPTGHVHLGLIYTVHLFDDAEVVFEHSLTDPTWLPARELHPSESLADELEYWSAQLVDEFYELATGDNWNQPKRAFGPCAPAFSNEQPDPLDEPLPQRQGECDGETCEGCQ